MELELDGKLSNKRIYPAVDIVASSTVETTSYIIAKQFKESGFYATTLLI